MVPFEIPPFPSPSLSQAACLRVAPPRGMKGGERGEGEGKFQISLARILDLSRPASAGFDIRILRSEGSNNVMEWGVQNRGIMGGIVLLSVLIFPLSAFCQNADIKDVHVKGGSGVWKVSFNLENYFTEKLEEAIQSGIQTTFTFYIQLYQMRGWWKDKKMASAEFHHIVQYDPIQKVYQVTLEENHSSTVVSSLEEAKRLMSGVKEFEIRSSSPIEPGVPAYFRIKAELVPVRLPFHLEYLFFFVSLWNFETDWRLEPLPP